MQNQDALGTVQTGPTSLNSEKEAKLQSKIQVVRIQVLFAHTKILNTYKLMCFSTCFWVKGSRILAPKAGC